MCGRSRACAVTHRDRLHIRCCILGGVVSLPLPIQAEAIRAMAVASDSAEGKLDMRMWLRPGGLDKRELPRFGRGDSWSLTIPGISLGRGDGRFAS